MYSFLLGQCVSHLIPFYFKTLGKLGLLPETMYQTGKNSQILHDVFEPNYLQPALEASQQDKPSLGHLIFGTNHWKILCSVDVLPPADDPLTQYFKMCSQYLLVLHFSAELIA